MDLLYYKPQSAVLREFIDLFYFLEADYETPVQFYAFPHICKPLNIHQGFEHEIGERTVHVKGMTGQSPRALLQGVYTEPILVRFSGSIAKVTIIFKDGALNHFMKDDFSETGSKHTQVFDAWSHWPGYESLLGDFFAEKDRVAQLRLLETFLLSVLHVRSDWNLYMQATALLKDWDRWLKIADVARELFVSERTLYRLIYKYNGLSPHNYRKIAQFRHSLNTKLVAENFKTLTDLAYSSNYYDASYFNKIYRTLTRKSPKAFFNTVRTYCNQKIVFEWQ